MLESYKKTKLWSISLGRNDQAHLEQLEFLRSNFATFRERAAQITGRISSSLPELTIHDINHLDTLWEIADLIAGPEYPLNPLEGFVLGGAILLHDAALCFEAFENGRSGVRETVEWKDAFALECKRNPNTSEEQQVLNADFVTLRILHAHQATKLVEKSWDANGIGPYFLIEDRELRNRIGEVIGKIASSHHWSLEKVTELPNQINAPASLPQDWRVDCVKIACLLRCSDALHLDSRRAPDFLFALGRKNGVSVDHWKAQNYLARADINNSDPREESVLITSNKNFTPSDSGAWWVAYDAISLANKELSSCNSFLGQNNIPYRKPFKMKNITGANSPAILSKYITTKDWDACEVNVSVGNVVDLISKLGGEKLYGENDQIIVVLRELIQNARDAIASRRQFSGEDFEGTVKISLSEDRQGLLTLNIEDNGIGMSERVLTGPLLDFGNSFWISNLVQEEFPGLSSTSFSPVGQFGIGFYSVFMVGTQVTASSRRWDSGLADIATIHFSNGISLRPILSRGRPAGFSDTTSTKFSVMLKNNRNELSRYKITAGQIGKEDFYVNISEVISFICAGLDANVYYKEYDDLQYNLIHRDIRFITSTDDKKEWLHQISLHRYESEPFSFMINKYADRLQAILEDGKIVALAALSEERSHTLDNLYVNGVGGLSSQIHSRLGTSFVGYFDRTTQTAKRDATGVLNVNQSHISEWVYNQLQIIHESNPGQLEKCFISLNASEYGVDLRDKIMVPLWNHKDQIIILSLEELFDICITDGLALFSAKYMNHVETHHSNKSYLNYPTFFALQNSGFLSLEFEESLPKNPYSLIGYLFDIAISRGIKLKLVTIENAVDGSFFGKIDVKLVVLDNN